jgi:hypothetical protein
MTLKERTTVCGKCGASILLPVSSGSVVCRCGTLYEYSPESKIVSKLIFNRGNGLNSEHVLRGSVVIGRESGRHYIEIRSANTSCFKENTYVRNIFVAKEQCKIETEEQIFADPSLRSVVAKLKCSIEDLASPGGTEVNNELLRLGELRELKHCDRIELAPRSAMPLVFSYIEAF